MNRVLLVICVVLLTLRTGNAQPFVDAFDLSPIQNVAASAVTPTGDLILLCQIYDPLTDTTGSAIFKCTASGSILWNKKIVADHRVVLSSLLIEPSGDILCAGCIFGSSDQLSDLIVIRFDQDRGIKANSCTRLSEGSPDKTTICRMSDGQIGIAMSCQAQAGHGISSSQVVILRTDLSVASSFGYNWEAGWFDKVFLCEGADSTLLLFGSKNIEVENVSVLFNRKGETLSTKSFVIRDDSDVTSSTVYINSLVTHSNGDIYLCGTANNSSSLSPVFLRFDIQGNRRFAFSLDGIGLPSGTTLQELPDHRLLLCMRNAAPSQATTASLAILDTGGRLLSYSDIKVPDSRRYASGAAGMSSGTFLWWASGTIDFKAPKQAHFVLSGLTHSLENCRSTPGLSSVGTPHVAEFTTDRITSYAMTTSASTASITTIDQQLGPKTDLCNLNEVPVCHNELPLVSLYPNPIGNQQLLTLSIAIAAADYDLQLRDLSGKPVYKTRITVAQGSSNVLIAGLASGLYTLEVTEINSVIVLCRGKVIVE